MEKYKNWMVRFDDNGTSPFTRLPWKPTGEWTEDPYWNPAPILDYGLYGQGPGGFGSCQPGTRFCFCETSELVTIDIGAIKAVKVQHARVVAVNDEAFELLLAHCDNDFPGSLDLSRYRHPLPAYITHCGGDLIICYYQHFISPIFMHNDVDLGLRYYNHPLPLNFTHCGRDLILLLYDYPLPPNFTHCGRDLILDYYSHPLPPSFTHCGGEVYATLYPHPLPDNFRIHKSIRAKS